MGVLPAKKAYQLGISQVYYIDPYPGIATTHILKVGKNAPELILFRGAVGSAFDRLYQPIMPHKDELALLFSIQKYENKELLRNRQESEDKTKKVEKLENENTQLRKTIEELEEKLKIYSETAENKSS
jgi:predicted RNase H-like nuclease (RuvC/YqgF family)